MKNLIRTSLYLAIFLSSTLSYAQYNAGTNSGTNGSQRTFVGVAAGYVNTGAYNTFIGQSSGRYNTSGDYNTFIGRTAGYRNTTGRFNTFLGTQSGYKNTTGSYNTFLGRASGYKNTTGRYNVFVGQGTGYANTTQERNTYIGQYAGRYATGGSGVFIGYGAGYFESGNNKLYIDNTSTATPLIYGDFATNELTFNGTVNIGNVATPTGYKLYVDEGILTEKVKIAAVGSGEWADYVFEEDYELNSTTEVEQFIKANKHLPNVPSAKQVEENGFDIVEMDATLLRQVEELWLHVIELKKENEALKAAMAELK